MEFIDLKQQYQSLKADMDAAVAGVLQKANFIMGDEVQTLEKQLASFVGVKHCISCANGTDALTLALKAFDLRPSDAVFVPTFTFFASAETVSQNGSPIFFVDVDETYNVSAVALETAIVKVLAQGQYTPKVIVTVDLFGLCADYPRIRQIAQKYNMLILEDGAQGFGGTVNNRYACSFGDISTTSFFPAKPLGCYGDGGAVFTDNDNFAAILKSLRVHGKGTDKYDNVRLGYNSRLDTIQAAVLSVKLKAFQAFELRRRGEIGLRYTNKLSRYVHTPVIPVGYTSSFAQYTIALNNERQRNDLKAFLREKDVPTNIYYARCMHEQKVYADQVANDNNWETASRFSKCVLSLPMHPYLKDDEIDYICSCVEEYFKNE